MSEQFGSIDLGVITRTGIVRYAGASGDFNPLHHDEPFALSKGHPTVFGMGMYPAGIAAVRLEQLVGIDRLQSLEFRFSDIVWPGNNLHLEIFEPENGKCAFLVRADNRLVITGQMGIRNEGSCGS